MKKRILAMLLAIAMVIGMVPVQVFASETELVETVEEIIETTAPITEATEAETEAETTLPEDVVENAAEPEETDAAEETAAEVVIEPASAAPSGTVIGKIRVIVENTTFSSDEGASWSGTLVDANIDLTDDMTMMTAVLTALNNAGHTWNSGSGDWEITYISSIEKNGTEELAEFHGGTDSGWMGTLNDWFVDMGFTDWKASENELVSGDVIRVMYTRDRGADLGGGWGTNAGYLSSLSASAGTLEPVFDKETLDYTLTVESGVTSVDITAVAENKQDKVTVTAGGTEYRRGAGVVIANGTEITVACGDKNYVITVSVAEEEKCEHQWTDATCKAPKTCSLCGETEGEVGDHSWLDATCKAPKICSVCSATEGEIGDHSYVDGTCSVCGEAEDVPTPFSQSVSVPSNGDQNWGRVSGLTLSGDDGSIYETYWSSEREPFVLDVILGQDTPLDATITAKFSVTGLRAPSVSGDTAVKLENGKGTIQITIVSGISAFYSDTHWTINITVDDGSAALRPTHEVTLPTDTVGYTVTAYNSASPVIEGRKFSFKVTIDGEYKKGENFKVLANGTELTASGDVYTIENITEAQTVTVEGVEEKTLADKNVTIIAPAGSIISSGKFYSYFKYDFNEPLETTTLEDGRIQMIVPVPGSQNFLRVQHPDGVTYWDFDGMSAGSVFEITEEMLHIGDSSFTPDTVYANFEMNLKDKADLYLTANEKGWLNLSSGETWNLNVFRNFLSLGNSISNNCVALPDTHYTVIAPDGSASDVVTVTPDANNSCFAEITAQKAGTAIVLVTYDAVTNNDGEGGKQWSAIWPENTGVIVVTVDAGDASITTNMTVNEEANSNGKQVIDAEHDILFYVGSQGASYSFKPEDGCTVTVNRSTVGSEMTFGGFTARGVTTASDGTVTVSGLTTGAHIIRVEKGVKAVYQVIRARQVSYEILDSDGNVVSAGNPADPGEKLTIQFHGLVSPMEKLSGVYNANFGFYYNGPYGAQIRTSGGTYGVYSFSGNESLQKFTVTIPSYWNESSYALTDGAIKIGGFGSSAGAHRTTTYMAGKEVNTNASGVAGVLAVLPDITINTTPCGYNSYDVTLPTGEGYTVTGDSVPVREGESYSFTVTVAGGYDGKNMVVKVNGTPVTGVGGVYTVENVREELTVTVEGVTTLTAGDMGEGTAVYTNGVDGTGWGYRTIAYVDTVTLGGAAVNSCTWDGNTCNVLLSYETPKNAVVGFNITFGGSRASSMFAKLNGTAMTAGEPMAVRLSNGTAAVELYAGYNDRNSATKTFVLTTESVPEEIIDIVNTVIEKIDNIDLPVELADSNSIKDAREAYDALAEYQKQMVTNYNVLLEAEEELRRLKEENTAVPVHITVTIADAGKLVLAQKRITVTDINDNGFFDVDDALYITHDAFCPGGYASAYTEYGLGITMLWGDTSGSFGYWLNDASCWSLEDTVSEGDSLMAFVYQDKTGWSDAYARFDTPAYEIQEDQPLSVFVEKAGYDENWNTVFAPYDAVLIVLDTDLKEINSNAYTQNGSEITIYEPGEYYLVVSGANGDILVPATAKVTVIDSPEAKLVGGKSATLTAYDAEGNALKASKVIWSMDAEYAPYASITKNGKLTTKKVLEMVTVYAVAVDASDGQTVLGTSRIDLYPAVSQVKILDENGSLVNGKTVPVKVNDGSDETYVFSAGTYPSDAMGDVTWTVSDKKGALVTWQVRGNDIIIRPAENVKKGTVTLTAASTDGTNKKATVKLNIAVLAEDISVTAKGGGNTTLDDAGNTIFTVASGKSITLTAAPTNANATNKTIAWSVVEGEEYVEVTSSGKLTAVKDMMGIQYAVVRAAAKDGSGVYRDVKVRLTPLALGVQMYSSGRVCANTTVNHNMTAANTLTLNARVYPLGKANQSVTWKSSNPKIAAVSVDENGYATVTCLKAGKVTITATADDGSKEKAVVTLNILEGIESLTLEDQVIAAKKKLDLAKRISINPATATNKKLTWTIIGDTHGAKISAAGVLNTSKVDVSKGPVVLTVSASAQDGCGATPATCTVTVYPATNEIAILNGGETITGKTLKLEAGKSLVLEGFCEGAANVYTWKSNNKNVAVEGGIVTASEGAVGKTVTITCTAADGTNKKATVKIKIIAPEAAQ